MTIQELRLLALDKEAFTTIDAYLDFSLKFLSFLSDTNNIQAIIVSQNENNYQFFQYKKNATYNVTRPINSRLWLNLETFENNKRKFIALLGNIRAKKYDTVGYRTILNNTVYTIQQCIGCALDALPANKSNFARKITGDLFERFIKIILSIIGIDCTTGTVKIPVIVDNETLFDMSYQHDLIIKINNELKAIGSVKTSSKDRIDKIFLDKFLYSKLTETTIPHFAVFLNDVQRKAGRISGRYGINSTFKSGHFKAYTVKLNPLDGVYYCDIRPNMVTEDILKDHIKTLDHLLFKEIWEFL